ncbi:MAG: YraN family protein [Acidobacteriaceae bacterium]
MCTIKYIAQPVEMSSNRSYPADMGLDSVALSLERRVFTALRSFADRKTPKPAHLLTGEQGEDAAYYHLRALGYTIVARRWQAERLRGDLDLVAWDGPQLVIFEVKTRTAHDLAPADTAVDRHKRQTLRKMAQAYIRQFPAIVRSSVPVRFDILSVYLLPNGAEFDHIHDAFASRES